MILKVIRKLVMFYSRYKFKKCGKKVVFDPINSNFSYNTISLGDDVFIGGRAWMSSTHSQIIIGSHVMFGPEVHIYGGNHIINKVGILMSQITKDNNHKDLDVIIQDEVWIGGKALILTGVTIGRGAIVAANSVVTKNIEPYAVYGGIPAKKLKMRFTAEEITEHERKIYNNE